jgi:hypothetical protein
MLRKSAIRGLYLASVAAVAASLGIVSPARGNLVITPTFNSSITSDPNASTIEASINAAISRAEAVVTNNVTVGIAFNEMSTGLGQSQSTEYNSSYAGYLSLLKTQQTLSTNDNTAIATLPNTTANPVNGNSTSSSIVACAPLFRALGQNTPGGYTAGGSFGTGGTLDGIIGLNTSICNLSRTGTQNPSFYDLQAVAGHEIDEILGVGGPGSTLFLNGAYTGQASPTGSVGVLDLFRYASAGVRSFTLNPNVNAYFSINGGTTNLVYFDQNNEGADFSDWGNGTPNAEAGNSPAQLQDSFGGPGVDTNIGINEATALDVIGYNVNYSAVPEPASGALFILGAVGFLARRRRSSARA